MKYRSSRPEEFLKKGVLKICSKFTGDHPCGSAISIKSFAALWKSHFCMSALLQICSILSEHLFLGTTLGDWFWKYDLINYQCDLIANAKDGVSLILILHNTMAAMGHDGPSLPFDLKFPFQNFKSILIKSNLINKTRATSEKQYSSKSVNQFGFGYQL